MRFRCACSPALILVLWACGGQPAGDADSGAVREGGQHSTGAGPRRDQVGTAGVSDFNAPAVVAPEIASAWSGVRILLVDRESGAEETFDIPLEGADLLGESGLVVSTGIFLPDFIMDENGITSRSAEPVNPAVRVIISEDGMEDYEGWLFAAMPEIHPYPHPRYQVLLVEGIPADQ